MTKSKPCFLAGVCCVLYTITFAQADWPRRESIKDTGSLAKQDYEELSNEIPAIYYQNKPSALVLVDGTPVITVDEDLRMYRILNTEQLIIKNHHDNRFYLYWDKYWYVSDSATMGYGYLKVIPPVIKLIDSLVKVKERLAVKANHPLTVRSSTIRKLPLEPVSRLQIIVTTQPAELIQTKGDPVYSNIPGTSLKYVENSSDDIFRDSTSHRFYILLSGRWYTSAALEGPWTYKPADQIPNDFRKIPAGSKKARVMAHVANTDSARKAIQDANMIQMTRVPRNALITPNVVYDGGAEFSSVSNTGLFVSENSNIPVVNIKDKYYALQDGVWFVSNEAIGSEWQVSTERPSDIDKIPPTHRLYHARFVYVYDTTAEYVITGYTGEYLNSYIQNNAIVYGTGWLYKSWCRRAYYTHTPTWGAAMKYSAAKGWTRGMDMVVYKPKDITNF